MHALEQRAPAAEPEANALSGRTIVITGGRGYIATALMRRLASVDCRVRRVLRPGTVAAPGGGACRVEDLAGDLGDAGFWRTLVADADVVIHLAGQTSAYVANADSARDLAANLLPVVHLLEACRARGGAPAAVVLAGTATQVGLPQSLPVDELPPDRPVSAYDLHKLLAEQYLEYYARMGLVRGVNLRLANVYGPGPASASADRGILNQMMRRALRGEPLTVYGTGEYVRDYVHVDDVARAFLAAAAYAKTLSGRHFVIGTGVGSRIVDAIGLVAARVAARTGTRAEVVHVPAPADLSPIEARHFVADTTAFTAATGWRPNFDLAGGIDDTLAALLAQDTAAR
jgi:nucleoside-diphosphate-sugar epimerase